MQSSEARKSRKGRRYRDKSSVNPTPGGSPLNEVESGAVTRSGETDELDGWSWEQVLCSDPEMLIRQASRHSENEEESPLALEHRLLEEKKQKESLRNPTSAMKAIMKKMELRESERLEMTWQQQLQHLTSKKNGKSSSLDLKPNPLTPAMEEVIRMRSNRVSFDYDIPITPDPSDSGTSDEEELSDSSHEEYIPSSCKKQKSVQQLQPQRLNGRRSSPARRSLLEDEVIVSSSTFSIQNPFPVPTDTKPDMNVTFEVEEDDDDEFENVMLNESIMKFLRDDGVSLAEQQQEFRKYDRKKTKNISKRGNSKSPEPSASYQFQPPSIPGLSGGFFNTKNENILDSLKEENDDDEPAEVGPVLNGKVKKRRISVQNEVSPIRNKDSPPEKSIADISNVASGSKGKSLPKKDSSFGSKSKSEKWILNGESDLTSTPSKRSNSSRKGSIKHNNKTSGTKTASSPRKTRSRSVKSSPVREITNGIEKEARLTRAGTKRNSPELHDLEKVIPSKVRRKSLKRTVHEEIILEEEEMDQEQDDEDIDDEVFCKETIVKPSSVSAAMVKVAQMKKNLSKSKPPLHKKRPVLQKSRRLKSRCDTQSWNWAEVLLSHPEKKLNKRGKKI